MGQAVRFDVCPRCAAHGRIVFADGSESREVWTRDMGYEDVWRKLEAGRLSEGEAKAIGREIEQSYLPRDERGITHSDDKCPFFMEKLRALLPELPES